MYIVDEAVSLLPRSGWAFLFGCQEGLLGRV